MAQLPMHKYMAFFNGKKAPIEAIDMYNAVLGARFVLKVPKSKQGLLSVVLVELADGTPTPVDTASI